MKKEEFPTFLNQQPTIVFGRTGRELLIIVCGIVAGYSLWSSIHTLLPVLWWTIMSLLLSIFLGVISLVVALVPVAERPLEEWAMCWLLYRCTPRVFLYEPQEEDLWAADEQQPRRASKDDLLQTDPDED